VSPILNPLPSWRFVQSATLQANPSGMSDMPNGIPIQQHQRYFHSIADHNNNDISDIGKKRAIFYHNSNNISTKMARKYDILTDTILLTGESS
jgi:hypothetical protein